MTRDDVIKLSLQVLVILDLVENTEPEHYNLGVTLLDAVLEDGRAQGYVWWESADDDDITAGQAENLSRCVAAKFAAFFNREYDCSQAIMNLYNLNPNKIYSKNIKRPV